MTRWASSDWHLFHANIRKYEPIRPEGFEDLILRNVRETLRPGDEFWFLGDLAFGGSAKSIEFLGDVFRLCASFMVRGNHDKDRTDNWFKRLGFKDVFPLYMVVDDMMLTHFPMRAVDARYPDEMAMINKVFMERGCRVNVHGHTHSRRSADPRCVNVSVEVADFRPVDLGKL